MKKVIFFLFVLLAAPVVRADNFGCTCILCLASPGGPTQYEECKPTIEKLYKMLYDGEPFPDCTEAEYNGMEIKQGIEAYKPCAAGYQAGGNSTTRVCRKIIGWEWGYRSDDRGGQVMVPVYDEYTPKRNPEPYYIEVYLDSQKQGERFWYKIKK